MIALCKCLAAQVEPPKGSQAGNSLSLQAIISNGSIIAQKSSDSAAADKSNDSAVTQQNVLKTMTDKNLFKTLISIVGKMKSKNSEKKRKIGYISIYKNPAGKYVDFWNVLSFEESNGSYIDTTGYFEGIPKESRNALLETSKMSAIGLYVDKSAYSLVEDSNVLNVKRMISDVAGENKIASGELMARNKKMSSRDGILLYYKYPYKDDDYVNVCVCKDDDCKSGCKEIAKLERNKFM